MRSKSSRCAKVPEIVAESRVGGRLTLKRAGRNHATNLGWSVDRLVADSRQMAGDQWNAWRLSAADSDSASEIAGDRAGGEHAGVVWRHDAAGRNAAADDDGNRHASAGDGSSSAPGGAS